MPLVGASGTGASAGLFGFSCLLLGEAQDLASFKKAEQGCAL